MEEARSGPISLPTTWQGLPRLAIRLLIMPQIYQHRRQIEHRRQRVLLLRNPRHRLHTHRMQCENERSKPRAPHRQPVQDKRK